ncbi:MAG TPA: hypothetical protein VJN94_01585 [Candidatus Binataceae bacterium]|nr:hypothetical protein [Candidatus Binataceae bacterium]
MRYDKLRQGAAQIAGVALIGLLVASGTPVVANAVVAWNANLQLFGTSLAIKTQSGDGSLNINATFNSSDFIPDLIANNVGSGGTLYVGVEPAGSCKSGKQPVAPIGISLATPGTTESFDSGTDTYSFSFTGNDTAGNAIKAVWSASPPSSNGGNTNQTTTVTCPGGSSVTSTNIVISGSGNQQTSTSCNATGGGVIVSNSQSNSGGKNSGAQGSEQLALTISTSVANTLPSPNRAVDLFIEYPGTSGDEGACVTLSSTSVSKIIQNGSTVYSFSAH